MSKWQIVSMLIIPRVLSLVFLLFYSFSLCDPLLILRTAYLHPYCVFSCVCPSGFLFPSYCHITNYHTFNGKVTLILRLMNLQIDCSSADLEWAWLGSSAPSWGLGSELLHMGFVLWPRMKGFLFSWQALEAPSLSGNIQCLSWLRLWKGSYHFHSHSVKTSHAPKHTIKGSEKSSFLIEAEKEEVNICWMIFNLLNSNLVSPNLSSSLLFSFI